MYSIAAIIPAYNEEKTIGNIIETIKQVDLIDNIIVVSDGSKDKTAEIAKGFTGVKVIDIKENKGKANAIMTGLHESEEDIFLFLDADLLGLSPKHITDLLLPIIREDAHMTLGVFNHGRFITDLGQIVTPYLTGQRALKRKIIEDIANLDISRFGIEMAITDYVSNNNIKVVEVVLENVTHLMKEEKMGVLKGFKERIKMYLDIFKFIGKNMSNNIKG
ncbi:glycosyltransferase family 2 protein [Sporosalibacterium faouarense]|uniref:glycosyltransferase family 2 protein n=1 Tax=Sporosalibacterium faouarense TaxID=516123 RepID=UPI00141D2804|nr:glycosyltransferase family 2 protein [Sporosalibacterium faouarense]MTI48031.1 glycosyltransferase family 2 protein [Bacillota bacterium]